VFEAVLILPGEGEIEKPTLYVCSTDESKPITDASIRAETIGKTSGKLSVSAGTTSGTYVLSGLDTSTTSTLSVEITSGELLDILTFDNVIRPASAAAGGGMNSEALPRSLFGLPQYLAVAIVAIAGIFSIALLLLAVIGILKIAGYKKSSRGSESANSQKAAILLLLLAAAGSSRLVHAHAGDEHNGPSLGIGVAGISVKHFVQIETQFQAEIRTTRVQEQLLPKYFKALGQVIVRPDLEADVTPPIEGRLLRPEGKNDRIRIVGSTVHQGDVLVELEQLIAAADKVTLSSEKDQVETELSQAQQELNIATREKDRAEKLVNVIAASELDRARADYRISQEKISGLKNRLATLTSALSGESTASRTIQIRAPIDGVITQSHATIGEYVSPEKTLFHIVDLREVLVQADIFESDIASVQNAKRARITLEAFPNSFEGTLQSFGQQVDPEKRTVRALFNVANPELKLRAGMFTNVEIESGEKKPVLTVPKSAVFLQDGIRQIFKKTGPETYAAVPVSISAFRDQMALVTSGLGKGDRVAISGLYQIRMSPVTGGK
jgi:cobalt-zinc-cadmium efflux system membrane fusion protein